MSGSLSARIRIAILAGFFMGLAGCVSGGAEQQDAEIQGTVAKGPISNARVHLYRVDGKGQRAGAGPAYSTRTDHHGSWRVSIPAADRDKMFLVEAAGGSYTDESDPTPGIQNKRRVTLGDQEVLEGVLFPGADTAVITVQTTAMIRAARFDVERMPEQGMLVTFEDAVIEQRDRSIQAFGFDVFSSQPADPLDPSGSVENYWHAMLLGGMAYAMNNAAIQSGKPWMDYVVIDALALDLADCRVDGLGRDGNPVRTKDGGILPANIDLDREIRRFTNNHHELYKDTPPFTIVYPTLCRLWIPIDSDGDGVSDNFEKAVGTDINNEDSDGDGYSDLREILGGSDPLSAASVPGATEIGVTGENLVLADDVVWSRYGSPYWIHSNVTVSGHLHVEPGVVVKFDPGLGLDVAATGNLTLGGKANEPVVFTSIHDDSWQGDTAGDADLSVPGPADWRGLRFLVGAGSDQFDHAQILYGDTGLEISGNSLMASINHLAILDANTAGISLGGAGTGEGPVFNSVAIENVSAGEGIRITGSVSPVFSGDGRLEGISVDHAAVYLDSGAQIAMADMIVKGGKYSVRMIGRSAGEYLDSVFTGAALEGISLATSGDVTIAGSLISSHQWSGVVTNSTGALVLDNNRILNNGGNIVQGGGVNILNTGTGTVIKHNLIRGNKASSGGGIRLGSGINNSATVEVLNNLVIQNFAGNKGGGVVVEWAAPNKPHGPYGETRAAILRHNTISENTVAMNTMGGGVYLGLSAAASFSNNVVVGNKDNTGISEIRVTNVNGLVQSHNAIGDNSLDNSSGTNQLMSVSDFEANWYLSDLSTGVNSGSDLELPTYLAEFGNATTSVDGQRDGDAGDVADMGYHHNGGVDGTGAVSVVLLNSEGTTINSSPGSIATIDFMLLGQSGSSLGAGQDIDVLVNGDTGAVSVEDLGDGSYRVLHQAGPTTGSAILGVYVNASGESVGGPTITLYINW